MRAILISDATKPMIEETYKLTPTDIVAVDMCQRSKKLWYFVSGYINERGVWNRYSILPAFRFENNYLFNPEKIQNDWDQIVRK